MNAWQTNHVLVFVIAGLFIITAAVVIFVNIWRVRRESRTGQNRLLSDGIDEAKLRQAEAALVRKMRAQNPSFDADAFKRQVLSVCQALGRAASPEEIEAMSDFVTVSMLRSVQSMKETSRRSSDMWAEEQIRALVFADYEVQSEGEQVTLCLIASLPAERRECRHKGRHEGRHKGEKNVHFFRICMQKEYSPQKPEKPEWQLAGFAPWHPGVETGGISEK
ncbi:MAG: hypothetical protein HFE77_00540 [Clostridiales bacterium]|nr:hypothetical protein [Clostridiales bacterium]